LVAHQEPLVRELATPTWRLREYGRYRGAGVAQTDHQRLVCQPGQCPLEEAATIAKPFADALQSSKQLHRIPEDYLIALGLQTGFRLQGVSEINANPQDSESVDVHRLRPDLVGPKSERARMKAIGESDRMTLRFEKP